MVRHAVMVIGHGDGSVLQETINILDDSEIDFFIHWDKKSQLPEINAENSTITFIERQQVYWGTDSLIQVEISLLNSVQKSNQTYDYVHLISSTDIPLMSKEYFKKYFVDDTYIGFVDEIDESIINRVRYFYPIRHVNIRNKYTFYLITNLFKVLNRIGNIDRLRDSTISLQRGTQWFSIKSTFITEILNYKYLNIFMHTYLADEVFLQTILNRYKPKNKQNFVGDTKMALRYVDWKRGRPYTFSANDIDELKTFVNTNYAFARKVVDPNIVKELFRK